jgi:hypothetical protein
MHERQARAILRRWDAVALLQLAEHAARLSDECARAEARAAQAEEWAESWRDDFLRLCEEQHARAGITQSGRLVALAPELQS